MICGLQWLVILNTIFIILIILEMSGLLNILDSNKKSGFNNPNDIEEVRNTLAKYKIRFNTDYDELVIRLVAQMPYDKRMAYYNKIADDSEDIGTLGNLAPPSIT